MAAIGSSPSMRRTLRVLAAFLAYPDEALRGHLAELRVVLRDEGALSQSRRSELDALVDRLRDRAPLEAESDYVELFDRGRATSLHLFEHVHGDSRERGPAMVDLGQTYEKAGLVLAEGTLPDYLPVVLEFASTQPPREARAFLAEMAHILDAIFGALRQRASPYAAVLGALLDLAGEKAGAVKPAEEEALDACWAEPPAFDGCSSRGQAQPGAPQPMRIVRRAGPAAAPAHPSHPGGAR